MKPHPLSRDRGPEERYRIYALRGRDLHELASTPTPEGIGAAICQLHEDCREVGRRLPDLGALGVLDGETHEWLVLPWRREE